MSKDMEKMIFDIYDKIKAADIEELNKIVILENDVNQVNSKIQSGKTIYVVPKQYFIILESALEEAKIKKKEEIRAYDDATNESIEELFWKDSGLKSKIKDANNFSTDEYIKKTEKDSKDIKKTQSVPTNHKKRNISSKANKKIKDKEYKDKKGNLKKKIAVILATAIAVGGATGIAIGISGKESDKTPTTNVVVQTKTDYTAEVVEDFKQRYLEAYNEEYGTDYTSAELYVTSLNGGIVYELNKNGNIKHVTEGSYPAETEKALQSIGKVKGVRGYNNVMQIISGEKILGSYNTSSQEFIYSGNQIEDLYEKNFEEPTLEKLGIDKKLAEKAEKVVLSVTNAERMIYADEYNEILKEYLETEKEVKQESKEEEGFEIGD